MKSFSSTNKPFKYHLTFSIGNSYNTNLTLGFILQFANMNKYVLTFVHCMYAKQQVKQQNHHSNVLLSGSANTKKKVII